MKIAMMLPSLVRTGPGFVVKDLCSEFIKEGHFCKIFYFDDADNELIMPCEIEKISFFQTFDFDNWDIIHTHMFRPDAYVWLNRRKIKKSIVVSTLHNPISYKAARTGFNYFHSFLLSSLWPLFLKSNDKIICLNNVTLNELPNSLKIKSKVIFNGRNIDTTQQSLNANEIHILSLLKKKYKIIGTISSLTKRKGIDQAIKALQNLPDYALIIVGAGSELENLKSLVFELNLSERVLFLGFKINATDYLNFFDVFLMCSESEGFPLALIEAAAYGIPCVLSDIPILKSIISFDDGVVFYKLHDVDDLAKKIKEIYTIKESASIKIKKFYQDNLMSNIMSNKYLDLYQNLILTK